MRQTERRAAEREREDNEADQRHGAEVNFNINSV